MSRDSVERRIHLPVPPAAVWHALTDGDSLAAWFGGSVDVEPRFGGRVRVVGDDGDELRGTVEAADEPGHLAFRLWTPDGEGSRVEFDITEAGDGSDLTVTETRLSASSRASVPRALARA
jgi:uncharacterized protein YndB with AHSA1/START domain